MHSLSFAGKYRVASKPHSGKLKQLVKLSQRKEALLAEIQDIDRVMMRLEQEFRTSRSRKNHEAKLTISTEAPRRPRSLPRRRKRSR